MTQHTQTPKGAHVRCRRYLGGVVAVVLCQAAWAHDVSHDEALQLRQNGVIVPLERLIQQAQQRHPNARFLEAELERKGEKFHYEIELLTPEGSVRELEYDARSGQLLTDKEDD